ncbi:MAG: MBL fold metallo-hydrolase [Stomatobaculum sp.]|nr:MBL fold metallo-hydrolase [Stomatobaculum sp.]
MTGITQGYVDTKENWSSPADLGEGAVDFSAKHSVLIRHFDGSLMPMDEPWYEAVPVREGVWKVLGDGDYVYLIEGGNEALAIDTGYGAGNVRTFLQTLTKLPVRRAANSHDHFDHTANNQYFEEVFMSAPGAELCSIPFPSFDEVAFDRSYPKHIVGDGDVIDLGGGVDLEVFYIPDHAISSLAYLDRTHRILFTGDEVMPFESGKKRRIRSSVRNLYENMRKLMTHYDEFDLLCSGGGGILEKHWIRDILECCGHILEHPETAGAPLSGPLPAPPSQKEYDTEGRWIVNRKNGRPGDVKNKNGEWEYQRAVYCHGMALVYDVRRVEEWDGRI